MGVKCSKCGEELSGFVPESRLSEVVAEKNRFKLANEEFANSINSHAAKLAELKKANSNLTNEKVAIRSGVVDDEGVSVAMMLYNATPAEGRPEFADWLKSPPRAVAAYMAVPPAPVATSTTTTPVVATDANAAAVGAVPPAPAPTPTTAQPAGAPVPLTPSQPAVTFPNISSGTTPVQPKVWTAAMIKEARDSGTYAQHQASILASLRKG